MTSTPEKILDQGYLFEFFQAVKMIEDLNSDAPAVGESGPYGEEKVRFRPNDSLAFPAADLAKIEKIEDPPGNTVWRITENFMGLYGFSTPLPAYFAEMIAQNYRDEDPLRDFLDMFDHRLLSLFYRAWKKYRLDAAYSHGCDNPVSMVFCAIAGFDRESPADDWKVFPERLMRYAGLIAGKTRNAAALEKIVADYFAVDNVKVTPFVERKIPIPTEDLNVIGALSGRNNILGESLVLGSSVKDIAGQFRLTLGPLSQESFQKLQPGKSAFNELIFLLKLFVIGQLECELELALRAEDAPLMKLSALAPTAALGRSSWLGRPEGEFVSVNYSPDSMFCQED